MKNRLSKKFLIKWEMGSIIKETKWKKTQDNEKNGRTQKFLSQNFEKHWNELKPLNWYKMWLIRQLLRAVYKAAEF